MINVSELLVNFLINAAWQIAAIALVATICVRLLNHAAARYHHVIWVAALLLSVALPIWSVALVTREKPGAIAEKIAAQTLTRVSSGAPVKTEAQPRAITSNPIEHPVSWNGIFQKRNQRFFTNSALLLVISLGYLLFLVYRTGRLWGLWRRTEELKRSAYQREFSASLNQITAQCCAAFGLKSVTMRCSPNISSPGVVGGRNPTIILPEAYFEELPRETQCSILGHEMAHLARRDFQFNLLYELLLLPIAFHPLARFLKHQIDKTRELACDEMVTETLLEPVAHARSLISIAGALISPSARALTLGIFDANILEERIMKLTRKTRRLGLSAGRLLALTSLSMLLSAGFAMSTFSFELRAEQERAPTSSQKVNQAGDQPSTSAAQGPSQSQLRQESAILVERAKSADAQERAQVACDFGKQRVIEAIPQLISMLGDDSKTELVKCWSEGRWSPALPSFKQPSPGEQAAIALASMGTLAFPQLTNALGDSNASVRRNAAWSIGELTNMSPGERADAVMPLISLLNDSDAWVRMAAARALGELRDQRAGEPLATRLLDSDGNVRQISAWALGEMKDERAVVSLCKVLVADLQIEVRLAAAEALGEIRNQKAVPSLTQALDDAEPRVRAKAKWAISEIEDSDG